MKKKCEVRHIVTAVASIPVYKINGKTEAYKMAAKDGWGTVYRDENNALVCDEDCSANLYTKNGGYFGIFPYEEINTKEMPKQAACAAIITTDSCGVNFWAEDPSQIHIFVTYEESGLVDTFRVEYGEDAQPYDGETEISFEDLVAAEAWEEAYRAEIPGTVEYQRKQEATELTEKAGPGWMSEGQREQFRQVCGLLDSIKTDRDFYRVMDRINGGEFDLDVVNTAREAKECYNAGQYEQTIVQEVAQGADAAADVDEYRTFNQQDKGTAAEAASEGQETALGTPDDMAGTDATEAGSGQQAAPQAGEINLGKLEAGTRPGTGEREPGKQPGGPYGPPGGTEEAEGGKPR